MPKKHTKQALLPGGVKRAAIYVRVSSERQADRVSPEAQEADGIAYCAARGYVVVEIYRDVEKYRVGRRLVEPSGTRVDRPQLKRMLADARTGRFNVVIAWREDRLYRSFRPLLDVLECIEQTGIEIELVKEHFDRQIAPVKAWAARMELDAKHDRYMMGVAGRLSKGKVWNNPPAYGWAREDGRLMIDPTESDVVVKIFTWYAEGISAREIRRRLVSMGAKERREKNKTPWSTSYIYKILHNATYHTGEYTTTWDGQTFAIQVPPLISANLAARVKEKFARKRAYPARNTVYHYLGAGLIYCEACNVRMSARTANRKERKNGIRSEYSCFRYGIGHIEPGCCRTVSARIIDPLIWEKFWSLFEEPGKLEAAIEKRVAQLQAQASDAEAECAKLERQFDDLLLRRQQVITWALAKAITEEDMKIRLAGMDLERVELEERLGEVRMLTGNRAERLIEAAREYRDSVKNGAVGINDAPETPEQSELQFKTRRKLLEGLVTRIDLRPRHDLSIHTELDLSQLLPADSNSVSAGC